MALADGLAHRALRDQALLAGDDGTDFDEQRLEAAADQLDIDLDVVARTVSERLERAGLLPMAFEEG